ncbi:SCO0607 family lipoprotein [Streptomyces werraensis]|uniref:SCO0607 family lipoprotein n=1 Tax=Streptomyces werraensis TaxID=68284 RepID=UPI003817ECF3
MHIPRRVSRTATAPRTGRARTAAAALASAVAVVAVTGCAGFEYREDICSADEYPALSVGGTGSICVSSKEAPPAGFVKYPQGKAPQQVDDKWDLYWDTHTLDEDGKVVDVPAAN